MSKQMSDHERAYWFAALFPIFWPLLFAMLLCDLVRCVGRGIRWLWLKATGRPTKPSEWIEDSGAGCELCGDHATIFLGGQRLLCWQHYCAEMEQQRKQPR